MKKIIVLLLLTSILSDTYGQTTLTKQDYMKKSKNQKTAAWILLGGGTAAGIGGVLWATSNLFSKDSGPEILVAMGGAAVIGSIPLFIAAGRNKHTAMNLSFRFQQVPLLNGNSFTRVPLPSVGIQLSL